MKNEELNTDKGIREKLEGFSAEPPAHVWIDIQGQMAGMRRRKRAATIAWAAAAAVVVFAFIAGWMLNEKSNELIPDIVEQQQTIQEPFQPEKNVQSKEQPETFVLSAPAETNEEIIASKTSEPVPGSGTKMAAEIRNVPASELERENVGVSREMQKINLLEARNLAGVQTEIEKLAEQKSTVLPQATVLSESDRELIAANLQNKNRELSEEDHRWIVGAYLSPGYASHSASYSRTYSQNMNNTLQGGVSNTGGGLSIQYKSGKRLRIESGVYYAQNSQSERSSSLFFASGPSYDMADGLESADIIPGFANVVEVSRNGISMNSTAGVIKMNNTPEGAELNAITDASKEVYSTTLVSGGEFSQVFDLVEIPLYLRYQLLDKKFGIDVMGGLNAGLVVGNTAYIQNDYGKQNIGRTEDISTLNVSGTVGVGVNYALGRHFSLSMEPRFSYYLNSINTNPDVDYKPYRFGLFTGIYYEF